MGRLFEGGRLLQILSLKRGANSKVGAYLKLGANSSIYGMYVCMHVCIYLSRGSKNRDSTLQIFTALTFAQIDYLLNFSLARTTRHLTNLIK